MSISNVHTEEVTVGGQVFEIIVFRDADRPFETSFKVMKDRRLFPLKTIGGQLSYITFTVSDEVEQDAQHDGLSSPFQELVKEAVRMIKATTNG
ncbi:MAG: hypothetical protein B7Y74_11345 [Novosphingobium sp. 35-62-5]|nr:MAG: hypothetical protein B7Y74_11345 [Novosphingobium sp. 35-62-5]HQS98632.1 hypothetical protein [Novosphingobium sp.]